MGYSDYCIVKKYSIKTVLKKEIETVLHFMYLTGKSCLLSILYSIRGNRQKNKHFNYISRQSADFEGKNSGRRQSRICSHEM